jgi:hypothetical protein
LRCLLRKGGKKKENKEEGKNEKYLTRSFHISVSRRFSSTNSSRTDFFEEDNPFWVELRHRIPLNRRGRRSRRVLARDTYLSQSKKAKLFEEQVRSQQ